MLRSGIETWLQGPFLGGGPGLWGGAGRELTEGREGITCWA